MQIIFDYVLFHFRRVYQLPEPLEISYGVEKEGRIQILQIQSNFFGHNLPQPEKTIWKDWNGTLLPLFFDISPQKEWYMQEDSGKVVINFDLISSAFYLLSGWQEFYSKERDQFGRFPFAASVQAQHGFVTTPVVNYYFDILKSAVELAYNQKIFMRTWQGKAFVSCLTHDIDYCQSAWKVAGKPALQSGRLGLFLKLATQKFTGKDAWFNFAEVTKELEKLQAKSTFFFLPNHQSFESHPNADYDITSAKIQRQIEQLAATGHEIGVHGSHGSGTNKGQLVAEKTKIKMEVAGNRFHYLRFDPANSVTILEQAGLEYDTSLGFPEQYGFRNSYCHPFRLFQHQEKRMSTVWEFPLNLMDVTLHHPNYLQLTQNEVLPAITPMLQEIIKFHGVFTLLWHNENLSLYGLEGGLKMFRELTAYLKSHETGFMTIGKSLQLL